MRWITSTRKMVVAARRHILLDWLGVVYPLINVTFYCSSYHQQKVILCLYTNMYLIIHLARICWTRIVSENTGLYSLLWVPFVSWLHSQLGYNARVFQVCDGWSLGALYFASFVSISILHKLTYKIDRMKNSLSSYKCICIMYVYLFIHSCISD